MDNLRNSKLIVDGVGFKEWRAGLANGVLGKRSTPEVVTANLEPPSRSPRREVFANLEPPSCSPRRPPKPAHGYEESADESD